jgi:2-(1,2-epoxy-1,2-dihydrophenyl)acetyl-CoA isomerase
MDILLTNPTLTAAEALSLGLVTRVVADDNLGPAVDALATDLAAQPPLGLSATKRLVWAGTGTSIEQCLSEEARTVSELSGMADAREGLAAVIERRKPVFTGR